MTSPGCQLVLTGSQAEQLDPSLSLTTFLDSATASSIALKTQIGRPEGIGKKSHIFHLNDWSSCGSSAEVSTATRS